MKLKEMLSGLKNKKGMGFVIIAIIAGLLLMLLPSDNREEPSASVASRPTSENYCKTLEAKAESLISGLDGVDKCKVVVTLESGYRFVYATDQHVDEQSGGKSTDKTIVFAGNADGEEAILVEETMPKISGVAVVCKGASYETQYRIIELLTALFDIKSNRISVQT